MVHSITATVLGKFKSVVRAAPVSTAGATSIEVLTINHGLGACPDQIVTTLRTINTITSTGTPALVLISWNASTAVFHLPVVNAAAVNAQFDIVCERTHSIVQ